MPPTQPTTETIMEALAEKLVLALDLVAAANAEDDLARIAGLCRDAAVLAEAGAIGRDPNS